MAAFDKVCCYNRVGINNIFPQAPICRGLRDFFYFLTAKYLQNSNLMYKKIKLKKINKWEMA